MHCERKTIKINEKKYDIYLPFSNLTSKNKGNKYSELKSTVTYFVSVMASECKYFDAEKFLEKIKNTKFVNINNDKDNNSYGEFYPETNTIEYSDASSLIHELLHLSSSLDCELTGFYQYDEERDKIGKGINEGYTDYLFNKYFYKHNNGTYDFEVLCAQHIEFLIGSDEMEKLYFKGNLRGLIEALKKYATEDAVIEFINALDVTESLNISWTSDIKTRGNYIYCKGAIEYIFEFLKLTYLRKLDIDDVQDEELKMFITSELWGTELDTVHYADGVERHKCLCLTNKKKFKELLEEIAKVKGINQ